MRAALALTTLALLALFAFVAYQIGTSRPDPAPTVVPAAYSEPADDGTATIIEATRE
ncbi:MAG TPA: hypothetical protein VK610_00720 [Rhodothermales bacterium]|nr:hypothetical protein [Rhodothermales bacterium]